MYSENKKVDKKGKPFPRSIWRLQINWKITAATLMQNLKVASGTQGVN